MGKCCGDNVVLASQELLFYLELGWNFLQGVDLGLIYLGFLSTFRLWKSEAWPKQTAGFEGKKKPPKARQAGRRENGLASHRNYTWIATANWPRRFKTFSSFLILCLLHPLDAMQHRRRSSIHPFAAIRSSSIRRCQEQGRGVVESSNRRRQEQGRGIVGPPFGATKSRAGASPGPPFGAGRSRSGTSSVLHSAPPGAGQGGRRGLHSTPTEEHVRASILNNWCRCFYKFSLKLFSIF
jgi:hypothetical protein